MLQISQEYPHHKWRVLFGGNTLCTPDEMRTKLCHTFSKNYSRRDLAEGSKSRLGRIEVLSIRPRYL